VTSRCPRPRSTSPSACLPAWTAQMWTPLPWRRPCTTCWRSGWTTSRPASQRAAPLARAGGCCSSSPRGPRWSPMCSSSSFTEISSPPASWQTSRGGWTSC
jgi:hypothetical protein